MKTITQKDDQWKAFTLLVWTLRWFWSKNTGQFVQHPMGWGIEALQVLLLTASHFRLSSLTESEKEAMLHKLLKNI